MDKALPSGGRDCGFESRLGLVLLRQPKKVPEAGFEPAAFSLGGRRAIHCATRTDTKYNCSGGVVGYHASLTHWRSRVRSSPRILFFCFFFFAQQAGLAQLVERWSHNPKVVSSILTPGTFCVDELWGFRAWTSNPWGINVPVVRFHLLRGVFFFFWFWEKKNKKYLLLVTYVAKATSEKKKLRSPGIEPGSITWQATIITTRPRAQTQNGRKKKFAVCGDRTHALTNMRLKHAP